MKSRTDDLSPLARRGQLDEGDERQLRLLLNSSLEARLMHRAGQQFDELGGVLPGDEQRAAAIASNVMRDLRAMRQKRRKRLHPWLIPAVAALISASAVAGTLVAKRAGWRVLSVWEPAAQPAPSSSAVTVHAGTALSVARTAGAAAEAAPSSLAPELAVIDSAPLAAATDAAPQKSAPVNVPRVAPKEAPSAYAGSAPDSASSVLSEATLARREGRTADAMASYQRLLQLFPTSREAHVAQLTLGTLELARGLPQSALSHFNGYLSKAPSNDLRVEALWGRAQALLQLQRSAEAQSALQDLISAYPTSPYAAPARSKLASLQAQTP